MSVATAEPARSPSRLSFPRGAATTRAGAAVLWAIALFVALHGQRVLSDSNIPVVAGLLLAAYPLIDIAASFSELRRLPNRAGARAGVVVDGVAIIALLVSTLGLHTQAVLIAFGAWAVVSGLLQLAGAWRADRPHRVQLPLLVSGGISAIAGISFVVIASQHVAHVSDLGDYAVLGAFFFLAWSFIDRKNGRSN